MLLKRALVVAGTWNIPALGWPSNQRGTHGVRKLSDRFTTTVCDADICGVAGGLVVHCLLCARVVCYVFDPFHL